MPAAASHISSLTGTARVALIVIGVIVTAAALNVAAIAVMPIVAALLLAVMLWPLQNWLQRWLPRWIAAMPCVAILVFALAFLVGWGVYAANAAADEFQSSRQEYIDQYQSARDWLTGLGIPERTMPEVNDPSESSRTRVPGAPAPGGPLLNPEARERILAVVAGGLRSAAGIAAALLLTIFLTYLALVEGNRWGDWSREHLSRGRLRTLSDLLHTWSKQVRRYFLAKTVSGVVSGLATWIWLWFMDVPLAVVWGVLTLLLNFIPNVGALISSLPPIVLATVQLGWWEGLVVAAGLWTIETLVGNLVDPLILGNMLRLSLFMVLASLIFWGWLWGVAGAVMAPVITAAILAAVAELWGGPLEDAVGPTNTHA